MSETTRQGPQRKPSTPPGTATGRRATLLATLWRELRVALPLCVGVAAFLSIAFGDSFSRTLVYSLCIGLSIQFLLEGGRFGIAAWLRRRRPAPGAAQTAAASNWPGWAWMAPWVAITTIGGYAAGSLLADLITGTQRAQGVFGGNPRALVAVLLVSISVSIAATYFFYSRARMAAIQAQAEAASRAALQSQLMLLQSQLEPHMLFNTLANLRVLIGVDPVRAQAMLDRLIGFLRATLDASRNGWHPLASEFDRLADYLALMGVRMGPRLQVAFDLPAELRELAVPALLLQPLVENCIKHGLEPKLGGGRVEITARRDADRLALTVRDTGVGLAAAAGATGECPTPGAAGEGYGTAHVRERLLALYGARASFSLGLAEDGLGGTLAQLALPLRNPAGPS